MSGTRSVMEELEARQCWSLLASAEVGRLALAVDCSPEIFPVNHAVDGQRVLVRTAAGTKLFAAVGRDVALEVDGVEDGMAWSVVAKGVGAEVLDPEVLRRAEELLDPWLESEKRHVLEIVVEVVTGRRFPIRRRG